MKKINEKIALHSRISNLVKTIKKDQDLATDEYHIMQSSATEPNKFREIDVQDRFYASTVTASSVEEAFRKTQSHNPAWRHHRSTSVGDVIVHKGEHWMVLGMGMRKLTGAAYVRSQMALNDALYQEHLTDKYEPEYPQ